MMVNLYSLMVDTFRKCRFTIIGSWIYQWLDITEDLLINILSSYRYVQCDQTVKNQHVSYTWYKSLASTMVARAGVSLLVGR